MLVIVIKDSDDGKYKKGSTLNILRSSEKYKKLTEHGIIKDKPDTELTIKEKIIGKLTGKKAKSKVEQNKIKDDGSN